MNNSELAVRNDAREKIAVLQEAVGELTQIEFKPVHHFSEGLYARELFMPAGAVVIGKIHKYAHLNVIMSGKVSVTTPFGQDTLEGPCLFESKPDTKRAVFCITDCVWITFHPTEKTDPDEIEKDIILSDYSDRLEQDKERITE